MTAATGMSRSPGLYAGMSLAAGAALLAALFVIGAHSPVLLVLAPVGGAALFWAATRPVLALVVVAAVEVANVSGVLAPGTGLPIFPVSVLLGLLAVGLALRDPQYRDRINEWTMVAAALAAVYLATQLVTTFGSADPLASLGALYRTAVDLVFLAILFVLAQITARPWALAAAVVVPLAVLSVLTVINQVIFAGTVSFGGFSTVTTSSGELVTTLRYGGPLPDSNFWGRHLIMGVPLAAALLTRTLRSGRRGGSAGWMLAIAALLAGIYLTQSRGTFLSAGVALAVWFIAAERSIRRWAPFGVAFGLVLFAVPGIGNRLQAMFADLVHGRTSGQIDPSLLGRFAAQEQAALMWAERPLFGFGPGTFPGQVIDFGGRVPTAVRTPPDGAHNVYAQLAAESGLLGLLGWSVMILGFLAVLVLSILSRPRSPDRVLAAATIAAVLGWSVASIGLHLSYFRTLAVVLALVGGLLPAWPPPRDAVRRLVRGTGVGVAAGLVGLSVLWMSVTVASSSETRATQAVTLRPAGPVDGWYAYALDVRSRIELLPTIAVLVSDRESPVVVSADPVRGLLKFTATAPDAEQAHDDVQIAITRAAMKLADGIGYNDYSLQTVGSMRVAKVTQRPRPAYLVGGALGICAALATALAVGNLLRRRLPASEVETEVDVPA